MVKPPPKITNKFQTWYLVLGIALITILNLAMTSLLTRQSLRETAAHPGFERVEPVFDQAPVIANVDVPPPVTAVYKAPTTQRANTRKIAAKNESVRYLARTVTPSEKLVARSKPLFEPQVIRIPPPDPPVTFSAPRAYVAKVEYKQQTMSARIAPRERHSFLAKLVRKPWHLIKAVASKLH